MSGGFRSGQRRSRGWSSRTQRESADGYASPVGSDGVLNLVVTLAATSPAHGGDRVLCAANVAFATGEEAEVIASRAEGAINASADCQGAGVVAEVPDVDIDDEDPVNGSPYVRVSAPGLTGGELVVSLRADPCASDVCYVLDGLGESFTRQLEIMATTVVTDPGGAKGGEVRIVEHSGLGMCDIEVTTTPGQSAENVATALLAAYDAATAGPGVLGCPSQQNPGDLVREGASLVSVAATGLSVCTTDPGVGFRAGPHGIALPPASVSCGDMGGLDDAAWPMFRYCPAHQARAPFVGPQTDTLDWTSSVSGDVRSSPAIDAEGTAYFGTDGNRIYAVMANGAEKWPAVSTSGDVKSSPALSSDGHLYVGSDDNRLYKVDVETGAVEWTFSTGGDISSSPVINAAGTIYFGSHDEWVYALAPDGSLLWRHATSGDVRSSPAISADGKTLYIGSDDDFLYGLHTDPALSAAQRLKWKTELDHLDVKSSPALGPAPDFTVYVGSDDEALFAVRPEDGVVLWQVEVSGDIVSSPAIGADGTIYFGSNDNRLRAVDPDGNVLWTFSTGGDIRSSPAIGADGIIHVGSNDDYLYALEPDPALSPSQRVLWQRDLGRDVRSSPAIGSDGALYVGSDDNELYRFAP